MTLQEIKELIALANAEGLAEIEFEREGTRVRIRRAIATQDYVMPSGMPMAMPMQVAAPAPVAVAPVAVSAAPAADPDAIPVKSPIVGTYYDAPSPSDPPFVKVGDTVSVGQVLCIIESMKLMNEIESEVSGVVIAKLVKNASPVEYGEVLLSVKRN
jgi:acetyl-CoA carboxylase biotin carboxyl carrier protein